MLVYSSLSQAHNFHSFAPVLPLMQCYVYLSDTARNLRGNFTEIKTGKSGKPTAGFGSRLYEVGSSGIDLGRILPGHGRH